MNPTHEELSRMENGEAGIVTPASVPSPEKTPVELSPSSTSSSKTLVGRPSHHSSPWLRGSRMRLRSLFSMASNQRSSNQQDLPSLRVREINKLPKGYPSLAAFIDSDESFMIYRRFGFIQSRLLLDKQDELRQLEEELDRMDRRDAKRDVTHPMTRDLPEEHLEQRARLLNFIEEKFLAYANLLDVAQKMVAMNRPAKDDYQSVRNFMYNHKPLGESERSWVNHEEDIITLRAGREHAWLDAGIEKLLKWFHCSLLERMFGDERSRKKSSDLEVYYARTHITRLANCIITMMILVLLIVPIYTLYHLVNDVSTDRAYAICMGILVVATLAFSAVLSLFTKAKRHEILAAAAAYCAVLVVFLGNVGPNNLGGRQS